MRVKHVIHIASALLICAAVVFTVAFIHVRQAHAQNTIQHIVFIIKENHSFDNYFGAYPNVNGTTTGKVKVNGLVMTIPLGPFQDKPPDYGHGWGNAKTAYDNGAMDKFNQGACSSSPYLCYQEAQRTDLPNYWAYADNFVINDNNWADLRGPSFPNHMFTVAGASGPDLPHSAINNPTNSSGHWGCDAPSGATVKIENGSTQFPCFKNTPTLADELTAANVTWKYYAPQPGQEGYIWNTLDAFDQDKPGTSLYAAHDVLSSQFLTDVANNQLPQMSWLVPPGVDSEHPAEGSQVRSMCVGENWTVQQINAIMASPAWSSTVIAVTWDDYGGFYDHAAPQNVDAVGYGFRAPLLVISPYAFATDNPAFPHISHVQMDYGSVLKFAEDTFQLSRLGATTRDVTANSIAMDLDTSTVYNPPLTLQQRTCP
jgi:phospholipase C